jgi:nucleotide-binding universal stress UspA family protein
MLKKILVPLDGSPLAGRAIPYASGLARRAGGRIVLMRAAWTYAVPTEPLPWSEQEVLDWIEHDLDVAAARLGAEGVDAVVRVCSGPPETAIASSARHENVDTIVMSSHGRTGLGRWVYGSVAEEVLRLADVPVLLVPTSGPDDWSDRRPGPVVAAVGDADLAADVLEPALELAGALRTTLLLVHIVAPADGPSVAAPVGDGLPVLGAPPRPVDPGDALLDHEQRRLESMADRLRGRGVVVETAIEVGDPAGEIVRVAREVGASAVAMATHRRGEVARLVVGSVAMTVVARAGLPVLLVRPRAVRPARARATSAAIAPALVEPPRRSGPATLTLEPDEVDLLCCGLNRLLDTSLPDPELEHQTYGMLSRLRRSSQGVAGAADGPTPDRAETSATSRHPSR